MNERIRGIFHNDEDPEYWKEGVSQFPNKVPRFLSKEDATQFTKTYCKYQSNPDENGLMHSITTLTSWSQIETYIIPKIKTYHCKLNAIDHNDLSIKNNRFLSTSQNSSDSSESSGKSVYESFLSRLNLPIHRFMSPSSTYNSLKYLFYHMRCGIFVMIRNNEVVIFCPFVNKDYKNEWGDYPQLDCIDGTIETYYSEKKIHYREEHIIPDKSKWWVNGNIICNEHDRMGDSGNTQWWGDHFLFQLKDMISDTCNNRYIPDCEFFINKRDYPQLKYNIEKSSIVEPYGFIFDRDDCDPDQDIPLSRHAFQSYAPILSFYTSERFSDIAFPPSEDWEAATGMVFPSSFFHSFNNENELVLGGDARDLFTTENLKKFHKSWEEKVPTAFFRGTATGGGVTVDTNQRLKLASLSYEWSKLSAFNGSGASPHAFLDAKITGWNKRDKKIASSKMSFFEREKFPI